MKTSLSVLVPVYNEEHLVYTSLERLFLLNTCPSLERVEVIVVDDCSTDRTSKALESFQGEFSGRLGSKIEWIFVKHERNGGKGQAVQTALQHATCDITVIHDADLEYHPKDLIRIIDVFLEEKADAVFGSRFAGGGRRRVLFYRHELGNRLLTFVTNVVTNLNLTDMETCYKAVRTALLKSIPIESNDFRMEPELTIKIAKRGARIFEVPISYSGRTYEEGKKINWRDGFKALWAIIRFALSDRIFQPDAYGNQIRSRLARSPRFNTWMADAIREYCGDRVLEIGSGVGNLTRKLIPRHQYVASDINPFYLQTLEALSTDRPYLTSCYCDVTDRSTLPQCKPGFDTVICLNVIEHVVDDRAALANIRAALAAGGRAIVLVPQGQWNFGSLDKVLCHQRRYSLSAFRALAEESGFTVKNIVEFNRLGTLVWFMNGKVWRRRTIGLFQVWMLELVMPILRTVDSILPFPGLSLIAVLERAESVPAVVKSNAAGAGLGAAS